MELKHKSNSEVLLLCDFGKNYRFTTFAAALSLPATSTCATYTPAGKAAT